MGNKPFKGKRTRSTQGSAGDAPADDASVPSLQGDTLLQELLCEIRSRLGADFCAVSFPAGSFEAIQAWSGDHPFGGELSQIPLDVTPAKLVMERMRTMIIYDVATEQPDNLLWTQFRICSYAGTPLVVDNGRAIGTLCLTSHEPIVMNEDHRFLLEACARAIVSRLEVLRARAQLHLVAAGSNAVRDLRDEGTEEARSAHAEVLLQGQIQFLERIAAGAPIADVLDYLARLVEEVTAESICSIQLLDPAGMYLCPSGPSRLPEGYSREIEGIGVGPTGATCGAAAHRREPVVTFDIAADPLWTDFRAVALKHGLRACWSVPIVAPNGKLLGTLDLYHQTPRIPRSADIRLLELAAGMAGIAIERWQTEEALREQERLYHLVTSDANDIVALHQLDGTYLFISPSFVGVLGYDPDAHIGTLPYLHIHPHDLERTERAFHECVECGTAVNTTYRVRKQTGEFIWFETLIRPVIDECGRTIRLQTCSRDVSERKRMEQELEFQSLHDPLTKLPNRSLLMDRLNQALMRTGRQESSIAILLLDLDGFKLINDGLGHGLGDTLLQAVANRLRNSLRGSDTVARFGGDEFAILLAHMSNPGEATRVAERVAEALRAPFSMGGHDVYTSSSVGIAMAETGKESADELIRNADVAMYRAKTEGKATFKLFHPSMNDNALRRLEMETDLRRALERGEFKVFYQPLIALTTGGIIGFEALVRWQHPKRGMVYPSEFISVAEETGLIAAIDRWVLNEACHQIREWQHINPELYISVNVSAQQFQSARLPQEIARVLEETGVRPQSLKLEITESVLMRDAESTVRTLRELKSLGVQLAIDDFGRGYSSLSYLQRFRVDTLKIDRFFVEGLGQDAEAKAIIRTVILLAKTLKLSVIGEGIETPEQLAILQSLGCDRGQGFYFAKPQPRDVVQGLLASVPPWTVH